MASQLLTMLTFVGIVRSLQYLPPAWEGPMVCKYPEAEFVNWIDECTAACRVYMPELYSYTLRRYIAHSKLCNEEQGRCAKGPAKNDPYELSPEIFGDFGQCVTGSQYAVNNTDQQERAERQTSMRTIVTAGEKHNYFRQMSGIDDEISAIWEQQDSK